MDRRQAITALGTAIIGGAACGGDTGDRTGGGNGGDRGEAAPAEKRPEQVADLPGWTLRIEGLIAVVPVRKKDSGNREVHSLDLGLLPYRDERGRPHAPTLAVDKRLLKKVDSRLTPTGNMTHVFFSLHDFDFEVDPGTAGTTVIDDQGSFEGDKCPTDGNWHSLQWIPTLKPYTNAGRTLRDDWRLAASSVGRLKPGFRVEPPGMPIPSEDRYGDQAWHATVGDRVEGTRVWKHSLRCVFPDVKTVTIRLFKRGDATPYAIEVDADQTLITKSVAAQIINLGSHSASAVAEMHDPTAYAELVTPAVPHADRFYMKIADTCVGPRDARAGFQLFTDVCGSCCPLMYAEQTLDSSPKLPRQA